MQLSDQLILAGILQAILYLFFVRVIDLYEREPLPYVVAVFLWGFAVATTIAVFFNTLAKTTFASLVSQREANAITAIFVAPVVEESAKGLALLIIFVTAYLAALRRRGLVEFAGVMDGIVYGSAVGFSLFEDIGPKRCLSSTVAAIPFLRRSRPYPGWPSETRDEPEAGGRVVTGEVARVDARRGDKQGTGGRFEQTMWRTSNAP